jgi:hypothetical protein
MEAAVARLERAVKDAVLDLARANLARADLTPDELPDDMEGRIDGFVRRWEARMGTGAQTGDAIYCVTVTGFDGEAELRASDLRALLLAYQEQRRALERLASSEAFDLPRIIDGPLAQELRMRLDYARAALTGEDAVPVKLHD